MTKETRRSFLLKCNEIYGQKSLKQVSAAVGDHRSEDVVVAISDIAALPTFYFCPPVVVNFGEASKSYK
ncbi:unnamed protein product [Onchocerca flexuosa]|uniref:tRNA_edit domain-containing protein n=1 Tax=Onchocerca flexuosa TaxID=387005 RepID=A0A183GZW8_9BILA|nr:unnamed protein product [Onchocerca flexuosa]